MKKIRKVRIHLIDENTGDDGMLAVERVYDENARLLTDIRYYDGVNIEQKIEKSYDADGRLLEEASYSESDEPDLHLIVEYNENGRLTKVETRYMAGNASIAHHDYDDASMSETVKIVDDEGELEETHFIRKDSEDRVLEEKITNHEGQVTHWILRDFDDSGRPVSINTLYEDGVMLKEEFHYEFDENGRLTYARIEDDKGNSMREEEFEYDEQGNRTEWRYEDQRRGKAGIERWEYDEKGNNTRHLVLSPSESPMEEEILSYDEEGNLTEREHVSPHGVSVQVYHYEYY